MVYENLQKLMAEAKPKRIKKIDLATMFGRDKAVITNIFSGKRPISSEEAKLLANYFGVTTDVILDAAEFDSESYGFEAPPAKAWKTQTETLQPITKRPSSSKRLVPVVSYVGAGAEVFPYDDHAKGHGFDTVECPPNMNPQKTIALEVIGDSMEPLISEGFLLFYDQRHYGVLDEHLGKICVIKVVDGPTLVKRIKKGSVLGLYKLICINPDNAAMEREIEWSAMVKTMVQR